MSLEHPLMKLIEARVNLIPGVRVWRANSGVATNVKTGKMVKFGVTGQADLTGIIGPYGRRLEIEVKRPDRPAKPTPAQLEYGARIRAMGGVYLVVNSLEEALEGVRRGIVTPVAWFK